MLLVREVHNSWMTKRAGTENDSFRNVIIRADLKVRVWPGRPVSQFWWPQNWETGPPLL